MDDLGVIMHVASVSMTAEATPQFRLAMRKNHPDALPVLQQAYLLKTYQDGKLALIQDEWRDVPTVWLD